MKLPEPLCKLIDWVAVGMDATSEDPVTCLSYSRFLRNLCWASTACKAGAEVGQFFRVIENLPAHQLALAVIARSSD